MRSIFTAVSLLVLSWLLAVSSTNPTSIFSLMKVTFAYGTFFYALSFLKHLSQRIGVTSIWSVTLAMYNLSWFISDIYIGSAIRYVWLFLSLIIGLQFVLFIITLFKSLEKFSWKITCFLLPFFWIFFENLRYKYPFCGFSWDLIGIGLSYNKYSALLTGFLGVSGLSLFTMFIALAWFRCLKKITWESFIIWVFVFMSPFLVGGGVYKYHYTILRKNFHNVFSVALIQPNFFPLNQRVSIFDEIENRWERIAHLFSLINQNVDLIVLPETILPYGATVKFFSSKNINNIFYKYLNISPTFEDKNLCHLEILLALSRHYDADILAGLERIDFIRGKKIRSYNSAFLLTPNERVFFYDKRLLVPIGEYFPGGTLGCKIGAKYFGIYSLSSGKQQQPLKGDYTPKFGVSICYEETFSYILQKYKQQEAKFLVNLTNDVWYPKSRLPYEHFLHGRLRGLELGLPYIRVCNTGITGAWDSLGNTIGFLPFESKKNKAKEGVIILKIPLYSYPTFYSFVGDSLLNFLSFVFTFIVTIVVFFKPKLFLKKTD